jgi:hypothetical protein
MALESTHKVVTANHLLEGDVIYLAEGGNWTRHFSRALVLADPVQAERHLASASTRGGTIVGAYLADVAQGSDGRTRPAHFREGFRMRGPSNRFHGKQSEGA